MRLPSFSLPPKESGHPLKLVESHLKWLENEDILKDIHPGLLEPHDTMKQYIHWLLHSPKCLKRKEKEDAEPDNDFIFVGHFWDMDSDEEDGDGDHPIGEEPKKNFSFGHMCRLVNYTAMCAYVGNFSSARKSLIGAFSKMKNLNTSSDRKIDTTMYMLNALEWSVYTYQNAEIEGKSEDNNVPGVAMEELMEQYSQIMNDNVGRAVIKYFQARLSLTLQIPELKALERFEEVVALDPESSEWYFDPFRTLRRIRRNKKRQETGILEGPCDKEWYFAQKAFDLAPNDWSAVTNFAMMIKETLWAEPAKFWKRNENDYLYSVELFRTAQVLAQEAGRKKWMKSTKLCLGELLLFGKGKQLDQWEGKQLFDELEVDFGNSTQVLHKVAKLLDRGAFRTMRFQDKTRAREVYKKCLKQNGANYPCLMDYMKFLKAESDGVPPIRRKNYYKEMLEAINHCLTMDKKDQAVVYLNTLRGVILWLINTEKLRREAIECWLEIKYRFPEFEAVICNIIKEPLLKMRDHPVQIEMRELLLQLEKFKKETEEILGSESELVKRISNFINLLS